jgi:hypothetical protein
MQGQDQEEEIPVYCNVTRIMKDVPLSVCERESQLWKKPSGRIVKHYEKKNENTVAPCLLCKYRCVAHASLPRVHSFQTNCMCATRCLCM